MGKSRRKVSGFYPKAQILLVQVVKYKVPASKHSTLSTRSTSLKLRIRIRRCLEWNLMQKPHDGAQEREGCVLASRPPLCFPLANSLPLLFSLPSSPLRTPVCPRPSLVYFPTLCQDPASTTLPSYTSTEVLLLYFFKYAHILVNFFVCTCLSFTNSMML